MVALRETEATERADWERKCRQKLDEEWKQQEDAIREKFRKERDTELDRVVHKLEAEVISGRKELEAEFHERMRLFFVAHHHINCTVRKCNAVFPVFFSVECEANLRRKLPS